MKPENNNGNNEQDKSSQEDVHFINYDPVINSNNPNPQTNQRLTESLHKEK